MEDMQQSWLKHCIHERMTEIQGAAEPLQALSVVAYEIVRDKLLRIVNTDFGTGKLVLLGGIQACISPRAYHAAAGQRSAPRRILSLASIFEHRPLPGSC